MLPLTLKILRYFSKLRQGEQKDRHIHPVLTSRLSPTSTVSLEIFWVN